jgi:hypothetical protein
MSPDRDQLTKCCYYMYRAEINKTLLKTELDPEVVRLQKAYYVIKSR